MRLWTEIDPAELSAFSREAFTALDTGYLTDVFPNIYQDEVKFSWTVNSVLEEFAEYGDFDTEAPIGGGDTGEEKTMRLLPLSRKLRLSETEQVQNIDRIRSLAEDRADAVVRYVVNRLKRARAQALVTGGLAINENKIKLNVNYGRSADLTLAAPDALFGATGSDPIGFLRGLADQVADASGVVPDRMAMSTRVFSVFAADLGEGGYVTTGAPVVSQAAVNEVLATYGLPPVTIDDTRIGGQRLIPDHVVTLAASGGASGGTVHAPTVESRDARYNLAGNEPGIVAGVYETDDPPVKWVLGKAIAMPVLSNPDTTASAAVLPPA